MKLLALIEEPDHVCYRYRIESHAGCLAQRGWRLECVPLVLDTLPRTVQLGSARRADVVILQRKLLPFWQLALLRKLARVLIYDFDDALFHRDSYNPKGPGSRSRLAHFWATVYAADAVIAGNPYLRDQAAALVPGGRVHLVPTCVDAEAYRSARHAAERGPVKLAWIGQMSTLRCLDKAQPLLAAAAAAVPGLELRVISSQAPSLAGVRVALRPWSIAGEAAELADADIGISWLPDDAWSRGKCGLKVLQYMAAGLPVVANPVGMNCEMVIDGKTGFVASTADEWASAISRLAADSALRRRMGAAGRTMVRERYHLAGWGPRFAAIVEEAARMAGVEPRPRRGDSAARAGIELAMEPVT